MEKLVSNESNSYFNLSLNISELEKEVNSDDFMESHCNISFGCYLRHSITWTIAYITAYLIVFLIGLIGNLSVLWIINALRKQTHTSSTVSSNKIFYRFVGNLALADLLVVLFCLPPTLVGNIYGRK